MKMLCVPCDEAMTLHEARGPDDGSMTVLFRCPACGRETAMLTNAMETQVVRSLGVRIGGRTDAAAPMETVRSSLAHRRAEAPAETPAADGRQAPLQTTQSEGAATGSRCPFTGMVEEAFARQEPAGASWTREAEERIGRIPTFARPMVRKSVEEYARERGYAEIDVGVLDEVRGRLGM